MSDNVYAAPISNFDDQVRSAADDQYYVVSARKLMIMIFATAGSYLLYWSYKNWALHKRATDDSVWPVPRAIFGIFFTHTLYRNIANHDVTGKRGWWDCDRYATIKVLLMLINYVLSWTSNGSRLINAITMLTIIPTALVIKRVQAEINARCGDPDGSSNDAITGANIIWMVIGALIWLMALASLLLAR